MKNIKHTNIMAYKNKTTHDSCVEIICRGCTMCNREEVWESFISSISGYINREIDNSYLTFVEEPGNQHDPNAIQVVCRGEIFGMAGYVGKEYTGTVKNILTQCNSYRIEIKNENEVGQREICLLVYWN